MGDDWGLHQHGNLYLQISVYSKFISALYGIFHHPLNNFKLPQDDLFESTLSAKRVLNHFNILEDQFNYIQSLPLIIAGDEESSNYQTFRYFIEKVKKYRDFKAFEEDWIKALRSPGKMKLISITLVSQVFGIFGKE
jgi:hypothetical protein